MAPSVRTLLLGFLVAGGGVPPLVADAQTVRQGPFAGVRAFGEAAEVVTLTDSMPIGTAPTGASHRQVYDFRINASEVGVVEPAVFGSAANELGGSFQAEGVAADLDGDGREEAVFAKELGDGSVEIVVIGTRDSAPAPAERAVLRLATGSDGLRPMIENANPWGDIRSHRALHLAAGRFRGDSAGVQVAVAWWADDESLELVVLDDWNPNTGSFGTLVRRAAGTPPDVMLGAHPTNPALDRGAAVFELASVDFDGDGIDELALVWPAAPGAQIWSGKLDVAAYALEAAGAAGRQLVQRGAFPAAIDMPLAPGNHYLERIEGRGANLPPLRPARVVGFAPQKLALVFRLIRRAPRISEQVGGEDWLVTLTAVVELERPSAQHAFSLRDVAALRPVPERGMQNPGSPINQYWLGRGAPPRWDLCMDAANLDGDGFDEVVVWDMGITRIFDPAERVRSFDDPLEPLDAPLSAITSGRLSAGGRPELGSGTGIPDNLFLLAEPAAVRCNLAVVDIEGADDIDATRPEIVLDFSTQERGGRNPALGTVAEESARRNRLVWLTPGRNGDGSLNGSFTFRVAAGETIERAGPDASIDSFRVAAFPDLDGDRVRLGEPSYAVQEILQPLVYLSAPPTHFDVLNGITWDPNACYLGPDCDDFAISYAESNESELSFETTFNSAWQISTELTASAEVETLAASASVEGTLSASYGQDFSRSELGSRTFRVEQRRSAVQRDQMLASRVTYEFFEYPVFRGSEVLGFVSAVVPTARPPLWVSDASTTAIGVRPRHEPGNLLSYPPFAALDVSRTLFSPTSVSIEPGTNFTGTLSFQSGQSFETTRGAAASIGASATVDGSVSGGVGGVAKASVSASATVAGDYEVENIRTNTTTVTSAQQITWNLGGVQDLTAEYEVTPVVRFDGAGALRVDYAVDFPAAPTNFFRSLYGGRPDLALNLPRRLDIAKGLTTLPDRELETKSLGFFPTTARPGQPVRLFASVYNMSLAPAGSPAVARFYWGDPRSGGAAIGNRVTAGPLPARGTQELSVDWTIPANILQTGEDRIFVRVESQGGETELRTDNNLGFARLPGIAVPEPGAGAAGLAALAALTWLRRRSQGDFA